MNEISDYVDDYFPWMRDYMPKPDTIINRQFFPRAPVAPHRPYGNIGTVTLAQLIKNAITDCGWIGYC